MDWFRLIEKYYKNGLWTEEMVLEAVNKGKITEEEYNKIINE